MYFPEGGSRYKPISPRTPSRRLLGEHWGPLCTANPTEQRWQCPLQGLCSLCFLTYAMFKKLSCWAKGKTCHTAGWKCPMADTDPPTVLLSKSRSAQNSPPVPHLQFPHALPCVLMLLLRGKPLQETLIKNSQPISKCF